MTCLGENTENYITFTVPIEKEVTRTDKNIAKNICYILQFIDSERYMAISLSNLINSFSEGIHRIKCKYSHDEKDVRLMETYGIKRSIVTNFLNIQIQS